MRLIDADALKKALKEHFSDEDDDVELIEIGACWYHGAVLEKIDNAPTVSAYSNITMQIDTQDVVERVLAKEPELLALCLLALYGGNK